MTTVAVISPDPAAQPDLSRLLGGRGSVLQIWQPEYACLDGTGGPTCPAARAADAAQSAGAEIVCLGPGLSDEAALKIARAVDYRHPSISSLIIAEPSVTLLNGAVRAGVRGLLPPSATLAEWDTVLTDVLVTAERRAAAQLPPPQVPLASRVIVVLSPKGGSGKTTISVNLAAVLAGAQPDQVALVDLDVQFGDVASSLQLTPAHTLVDVSRAAATLDATTLKVFLTAHQSGLWILAAPATPAAADDTHPADAVTALRLLREQFATVVVDTGSGLDEHTLGAIELATDLLFVTTMDVSSVRGLRKLLDVVDHLGIDAQRYVVLNRADAKAGVDVADITRSLGAGIDFTIPTSSRVALAANHGMTMAESDARSAVSRQFAALAARFEPESSNGHSAAGFLRRRKERS